MLRLVLITVFSAAAIVVGDIVFRTSLLQLIRPVVLAPPEQAILAPPINVEWDGPPEMQVWLRVSGGEKRDLGFRSSPLTLQPNDFPREGGYEVELRAPTFPDWINATRRFQIRGPAEPAPTPEAEASDDGESNEPTIQMKDFLRALKASRTSRDRAHQRAKFLTEENAGLRSENERLSKQLEKIYQTEEQDGERSADLERQITQLGEQLRGLADENAALRLRLSMVIPCTVWGYYSYPRASTYPATRRALMVSDLNGTVFRNQLDCEGVRRTDTLAASPCFCVGNSWAG